MRAAESPRVRVACKICGRVLLREQTLQHAKAAHFEAYYEYMTRTIPNETLSGESLMREKPVWHS